MRTQFIQCPQEALQAEISPTAYKVYLALKSFDGKERQIFPSKKTLAEKCGLGLTSIYTAIKQLIHARLVAVVARFDKNGRQTSNFYQLTELSSTWSKLDPQTLHLPSTDLKVYTYLTAHADEQGQCFPSQKKIAHACRLSLVTVYRALWRLQQRGLLAISHQQRPNGGTRENLYTLLSPSESVAETLSQGTESTKTQPSVPHPLPEKFRIAREKADAILRYFSHNFRGTRALFSPQIE